MDRRLISLSLQDFRARFTAAYEKKYKAVRMLPAVASLPLDSREKSSIILLAAVQATIRDMTDAASGRPVSLNPLRQALYGALLAREVAIASAPTTTRAMAAQVGPLRRARLDRLFPPPLPSIPSSRSSPLAPWPMRPK